MIRHILPSRMPITCLQFMMALLDTPLTGTRDTPSQKPVREAGPGQEWL